METKDLNYTSTKLIIVQYKGACMTNLLQSTQYFTLNKNEKVNYPSHDLNYIWDKIKLLYIE